MKVGQISFKKLSDKSDYLQLDICGLSTEEALSKYNAYGKKIPVILQKMCEKPTPLGVGWIAHLLL